MFQRMECSVWLPVDRSRLPVGTLLALPVRVRCPMWGFKRLIKSKPSKYQLLLFYLYTQRRVFSQNELFKCKMYSSLIVESVVLSSGTPFHRNGTMLGRRNGTGAGQVLYIPKVFFFNPFHVSDILFLE